MNLSVTPDMISAVVEAPDGKTMTVIYANGMKEIVTLAQGAELAKMLGREKQKMVAFEKRNGIAPKGEGLGAHRGTTYKGPIRTLE